MAKTYKRKPAKPRAKAASKPAAKKAPARERPIAAFFASAGERTRLYFLAGSAGLAIIVTGLVGLAWAGGYVGVAAEGIARWGANAAVTAGLEVRRVTVMGRSQTEAAELEAAIGPVIGASLLHLDIDAARARVEELGWVRVAAVSRLYPDTVHVSIRERVPSAVWQVGGALHLIDDEGAPIREIGAFEYSNLPLIVGAGAPEAAAELLTALGQHDAIKQMTAALVRVSGRRWNLRLRQGFDVQLPEIAPAAALAELAVLHDVQAVLDQDLEYIDLRDPERIVIRRRGDTDDAPAG